MPIPCPGPLLTSLLAWACVLVASAVEGAAVPSAHAPQYDSRDRWSADTSKSYHAQQVWPKGRLLVWANPGQSANQDSKPLDPKWWLEDGVPATKPMDAETDLEFPAAPDKKRYFVSLPGGKSPITWRRHLTVGENVVVTWLHGATGNTWVKPGGKLGLLGWIGGDKHAFLRNDNPESWWVVDHLYCQKDPQASIELLGPWSVDDSYHFGSGMTILGVDSVITPQARSNLNVSEKAALVLLSGATYRKQGNQTFAADLVVRGRLMAGLPERPLTRDCTLGLSWKAKRRFLGGKADTYRCERIDDVALIVMPGASLTVHSADPTKARLVLTWNGLPVSNEVKKGPGGPENFAKLSNLKETHLEIMLLGSTAIDGLHLDWMQKGGVIVADPTAAAQWKHVTWGGNNQGRPDESITVWNRKPTGLFTMGDF